MIRLRLHKRLRIPHRLSARVRWRRGFEDFNGLSAARRREGRGGHTRGWRRRL